MGRIDDIKTEIDGDPLGRSYSGMTDKEVADDMNIVNRTRNRATVTGSEILNATDDTEFGALTDAQKDRWLSMCGVDEIDTSNGVARSLEVDLFGPGTATRSGLLDVRSEDISRGVELGVGLVREGDVQQARSI